MSDILNIGEVTLQSYRESTKAQVKSSVDEPLLMVIGKPEFKGSPKTKDARFLYDKKSMLR